MLPDVTLRIGQKPADAPGDTDVAAPLKNVLATFPARLLLVCVFFGPFYVLGLMVLANKYLPASDASLFKNLLLGTLATLTTSGGAGAVVSSWFRTWGKVTNQLQAPASAPAPAPSVPLLGSAQRP